MRVNKKIVLIAGGTGLVGEALHNQLKAQGHTVRVLTRQKEVVSPYFYWNPEKEKINIDALRGVQVLVNLSGVSIASGRWTATRKQALLDSRIQSTSYLYALTKDSKSLTHYISASGITCYGYNNPNKIYTEEDVFGDDFLSGVVEKWEGAADLFLSQYKVSKVRTGVVLSEKGGAFQKIAAPIKKYVGAPIGSGKQIMPWITLKDISRVYAHLINHEVEGEFNAFSNEISNAQLTNEIAKKLNKPLWLPKIPSFILRWVLGEMSDLVLKGLQVDNSKLKDTGFVFEHKTIEEALKYIYDEQEAS